MPAHKRNLVDLKEHLETKIECVRELIASESKSSEKALHIQALEYERRLDGLNHEAERLKQLAVTHVARETYERDQKELRGLVDKLELEGKNYITRDGRWFIHATALTLAVAIIIPSFTWLWNLQSTQILHGNQISTNSAHIEEVIKRQDEFINGHKDVIRNNARLDYIERRLDIDGKKKE